MMKKVLFAIALMLTVSFAANAQDGFIRGTSSSDDMRAGSGDDVSIALPPSHGLDTDQGGDTALGSGLLILTALGAGYALKNKRS